MKIVCIGSELISIVCVHTEFALNIMRFEYTFNLYTSMGGLKLVRRWTASSHEIIMVLYMHTYDQLHEETSDRKETTSVTV